MRKLAVANSLLVEVDGEVAGLTLVIPSCGPAARAERLVSQHELRFISTSVLSPQVRLRRTWRQGAKSSPLAMMHLW
jgi:hypothetical protein